MPISAKNNPVEQSTIVEKIVKAFGILNAEGYRLLRHKLDEKGWELSRPVKPRWDRETRTLYFGSKEIRRYGRIIAKNQFHILDLFEQAGWPEAGIAFRGNLIHISGQNLADALYRLTRFQPAIEFHHQPETYDSIGKIYWKKKIL